MPKKVHVQNPRKEAARITKTLQLFDHTLVQAQAQKYKGMKLGIYDATGGLMKVCTVREIARAGTGFKPTAITGTLDDGHKVTALTSQWERWFNDQPEG